MNWIKVTDRKPTEPFMSFGWSNHILAYSLVNECWFEVVYNFRDNKFYTIDQQCLDEYKISHFCEDVPVPTE